MTAAPLDGVRVLDLSRLLPGGYATLLGLAELAGWHLDPARQPELVERIGAVFATRGRDEWAAAFAGVDACVTPVLDLAEALADPAARARGTIGSQPLPGGGALPVLPTAPGLPARPLAPAPGLGEHTAAVFAELGRVPADSPGAS
ncbi:MAG TPA: CoA transferase [Mycobacteriales bacterium]|nr:CoA transferase [Mycobacteriales bacterium]